MFGGNKMDVKEDVQEIFRNLSDNGKQKAEIQKFCK